MTADDLLRELDARGIRLRLAGRQIVTEGLTTPRLRDAIRANEAALVLALAGHYRCPRYVPLEGTRRCRSYHPNGVCARPDELMCVEWLRANGFAAPR